MIPGFRKAIRAGILALACLGTHASAAPKPELQELRGRIESLQKALDSKEDAKADAADELKTSEQAISEINSELRDLTRQQQASQATLKSLEQEKNDLDKRIGAEQAMLGRLLYQQYRSGQQDQFKILLNQENPGQAARQLRYYTYLARARSELLEKLRGNLIKLHRLTQESEIKQTELSKIRSEQDKQRGKLLAQQEMKKKLVTQLAKQIGQQRSELSRLQRNEKKLTQLIERLAKQQRATTQENRTPVLLGPQLGRTGRFLCRNIISAAEGEIAASGTRGTYRAFRYSTSGQRFTLARTVHSHRRGTGGTCHRQWPGGVLGLAARLRQPADH